MSLRGRWTRSCSGTVSRAATAVYKRRVLILIYCVLLLSSAALTDDFVGQASIIDGDTLEIHGTRIHLSHASDQDL